MGTVLATIGPGVIGLGIAIGSGEWLLGPAVVASYGPALLWITTVAVVLQTLLNLEMARYTLYTGEPIITGFMRTRPGPAFWGWTYGALAFLQYGWPGWALASATATAALVLGRLPTAADAGLVVSLGYVTFGVCVLVVSAGRKIERTLEYAMWFLLAWVALYLLVVDVATVPTQSWARVLAGFASFGSFPASADWTLLGAFAAFSGLGGAGNAFVTNWLRDKGYGMGKTVGFIPTVLGGKAALSPRGNVFDLTEANQAAWRGWWRFVAVDQWGIFAIGSIAGMGLTCLLTLHYVAPGAITNDWAVANMQASGVAQALGPVFWPLTLVCGLGILFSTQLGIVDGMPRFVTDMVWSGSEAVRRRCGGDARAVYYTVLGLFAVWGCVALNLARPLTLIVISANVAGVILVALSLHTLAVNRSFLPPALRPSRWRQAAVVACAAFYGAFAIAAMAKLWR
jgi:hypothetical protein